MEDPNCVKAPKESQSESEEEPKPVSKPVQKGKQGGGAKDIEFISISNPDDVIIREDVHSEIAKAEEQVKYFSHLLAQYPKSLRGEYRLATALHRLSKQTRNVNYLRRSIAHYENVIDFGEKVPQEIFKVAVENCLKNMRLLEQHEKAERIHQALIERFPSEPSYRNELTITYLIQNKWKLAKEVLEVTLSKWPKDGVALVHYGFIIKINFKNMPDAVKYLKAGIESGEQGTADGRFYFHLGDALARLGKESEALKVYNEGAQKGLFLSAYQRSLYFVPRLTGRPWWTLKQTTYETFFESLEQHWKIIKAEGQAAFLKRGSFKKEQENLVDVGDWKEFQLFARGRRNEENCKETPRTCSLVSQFPPAAQCRRGQTKFSVMTPNTHVWPHCGPSNDRLRSHLGLHGLKGAFLRVANETREWRDGKIIVFDDSFEHEVWHNGSSYRLVLIVDVWHPEITAHEKKTLPEL